MALPPDPGPPPESGPLLFVGGLYEAKGAQVAIEAARGTGRTLVIAGDTDTPEGRRLCEYVAREQITEVRFAGFQTGEALSRLYAECAAVIVPSLWWENVPHVALEAMAQGRPVLASNHGSLPEVVTHGRTGLLFTPGDALALRRAIEELARSGMAATYGREARRWIAAVADPASHFARLEDILTRACR
jgi:glycosyltransferase involved in cell wall biosynthesis